MSARRITNRQRRAILRALRKGVPGPIIGERFGVNRNYATTLRWRLGLPSVREQRWQVACARTGATA